MLLLFLHYVGFVLHSNVFVLHSVAFVLCYVAFVLHYVVFVLHYVNGVWWRSGRVSDFESRGPGFDPHRRHRVVSWSKTH